MVKGLCHLAGQSLVYYRLVTLCSLEIRVSRHSLHQPAELKPGNVQAITATKQWPHQGQAKAMQIFMCCKEKSMSIPSPLYSKAII